MLKRSNVAKQLDYKEQENKITKAFMSLLCYLKTTGMCNLINIK